MQADNPLISVIVPVYNEERYLQCCIQSIREQTFKQIEIIIVNDGSTDNSGKICDGFAAADNRIQVIHKKKGGLVLARKTGIKAASGKYIAYVDSDDWIEPDMISRLYNAISEQDVDIAICGYYEDTGSKSKTVYHGIKEGRYDKNALMKDVYSRMIVNSDFFEWGIIPGVVAKLFKKENIERFQFEVDERITMGEDAACIYPCLLSCGSIYVMHECLYHYRQVLTSMVRQIGDPVLERVQYKIMYQYTKGKLIGLRNIYDCIEQWDEYVLFLMFQRADTLYKGIDKLDFLFPYPNIKRGERILLYGDGTYGQRLYHYIRKTNFCKIVGWADRNYEELRKLGLKVDSPGIIPEIEYDHIAIAITYAKARQDAYKELSSKYGKNKLAVIDIDLIMSGESKTALGLYE